MCTVVLLRRPGQAWPLILGANRDEMLNRAWKPPARHWPERTDMVAGLDEVGGGTWMGLNDTGVVACILNRHGSLGPLPGKRSRGELVLEALDHADASDAAYALSDLDPASYRSFNMIIADNRDAWWLSMADNKRPVRLERIPEGLSMFTAQERNDESDARIAAYLPRFRAAPVPDPDAQNWEGWRALLASTDDAGGTATTAMSFRMANGFGTSSSSLLAVPSVEAAFNADKKAPIWLFAAGAPDHTSYAPVDLT